MEPSSILGILILLLKLKQMRRAGRPESFPATTFFFSFSLSTSLQTFSCTVDHPELVSAPKPYMPNVPGRPAGAASGWSVQIIGQRPRGMGQTVAAWLRLGSYSAASYLLHSRPRRPRCAGGSRRRRRQRRLRPSSWSLHPAGAACVA